MRHQFTTKRGNRVIIECREGTNDRMVAESIIEADEYAIAELEDIHEAVDIGAHIGAWTIAILLDFPDSHVTAVEPLPPNVELMRANLELNGVADRCEILPKAFAPDDAPDTVPVWYGGDEMHRYIGNQRMPPEVEREVIDVPTITPLDLFHWQDVVKLDAEGAEAALVGADLSSLGVICGEYHVPRGPLFAHLSQTHRVAMGNDPSFGYFHAVPR